MTGTALSQRRGRAWTLAYVVTLAIVIGLVSYRDATAALSHVESRCAARLAKVAFKLVGTELAQVGRCRDAIAAGKGSAPCPDAKGVGKIGAALVALRAEGERRCSSVCSVSQEISCIEDAQCPPLGAQAELCSGAQQGQGFDLRHLGFPGPYCEAALGHEGEVAADLGECVGKLVDQTSARYFDALYGDIGSQSALSPSAAKCLAAVGNAARKLALKTLRGVSRCRDRISQGKELLNPATCAHDYERARKQIAKASNKVRAAYAKRCQTADLAELAACGTGDGIANLNDAATCMITLVDEAVDPDELPVFRGFAAPSLIESIYPPGPTCGDQLVNQAGDGFLLIGEECDGADDSACPGSCFPPGDLFECTCASVPRLRLFTDAETSEIDTGWTGLAHDQPLSEGAGFLATLSDCDCSEVTGGECTGLSSDAVCTVQGRQKPVCSWDAVGALTCDVQGNFNGIEEDVDCFLCDAWTTDAGASCMNDSECNAQCYDDLGAAMGPCTAQTDCAAGLVCRGRCDRSYTCDFTPNGAPHPVSAAGVAVCATQTYRSDVTGTKNLLTGAHSLTYTQRTRIHLGEVFDRPCPVCGGFCEGGSKNLAVCKGRCDLADTPCRFDDECPPGDSCGDSTPDCPGGHCQLSLVCGSDPVANPAVVGRPCRISYEHEFFGTMSADCQPSPSLNITGQGLQVSYMPATSGTIMLPATLPCTGSGLDLLDCPCPPAGGQPTAPNSCAPACDAIGPGFGVGCADGNGSGNGTVCGAGINEDKLCDEDADCPGGACDRNPTHCVGDPAFERFSCNANADCGLGLCLDACPTGRCLALCVPTPGEPGEAHCAAGPPIFDCAGAKFDFRSCSATAASASCSATCKQSGLPCSAAEDCNPGEACLGSCESHRDCEAGSDGTLGTADDFPGAGACISDERECFPDPIVGIGGLTLPGEGPISSHDSTSVWCFSPTLNPGIDSASGFGGPARIQVRGTNALNFTAIPPAP